MKIKILSWNIWNGKYLSEIIEYLKTANADIIGLQEVVQNLDGSNNIAQVIAEKLSYEWTFAKTRTYTEGDRVFDWGNAILSKHKIVSSKTHILSSEEARTALQADIQINKTLLHVFSTHLLHTHQKPSKIQELQADTLAKLLPKDHTIVMGDFNATPNSIAVKHIDNILENTDRILLPTWSVYEEGCPGCKPQGIYCKLDYIFVTKDIPFDSFMVGQTKGSDHLPISVEVKL